MTAGAMSVLTIGHSNASLGDFLGLLDGHAVEVVVDVRSSPSSRYSPHFSGEQLRRALSLTSHRYLFMGDVLGGRPADPGHYDADGFVRYDLVAGSALFQGGLDRLVDGTARFRVALMCSEEDPVSCHRRRLVARALAARGITAQHIRKDGHIETERAVALREALAFPDGFQFTFDGAPTWRSINPVPAGQRHN